MDNDDNNNDVVAAVANWCIDVMIMLICVNDVDNVAEDDDNADTDAVDDDGEAKTEQGFTWWDDRLAHANIETTKTDQQVIIVHLQFLL